MKTPLRFSSAQLEWIKWMAILTMTLDHLNRIVFSSSYPGLSWAGRLAMPLFAFLVAYHSLHHTRSLSGYMRRMFEFGIYSQLLYWIAFNSWMLNIFFGLALGIALISAASTLDRWAQANWLDRFLSMAATLVFLIASPFIEYHWAVPAAILCTWLWLRDGRGWHLFAAGLLFVAGNGYSTESWFALASFGVLYAVHRIQRNPLRLPRWVYYLYYPAHLALLSAIAFFR